MSTYFAVLCLATRSCPTLCNPIDCSCQAPLSMGILQATTLEWVAISFSRGSSPPRNQTGVSCMVGRFLPAELPGESLYPLQWAKAVHKISQYWLCLINKALLLMTSTLIPENMGLQLSLNTFLKDIYIIYIHTSVRKRKIPREEQWPNFCFCWLFEGHKSWILKCALKQGVAEIITFLVFQISGLLFVKYLWSNSFQLFLPFIYVNPKVSGESSKTWRS